MRQIRTSTDLLVGAVKGESNAAQPYPVGHPFGCAIGTVCIPLWSPGWFLSEKKIFGKLAQFYQILWVSGGVKIG